MGLYERLMHLEQPPIANHVFYGLVAEFKRGVITETTVATILGLDAGAAVELTTLLSKITLNTLTPTQMHEILMLSEQRADGYETVNKLKTKLGV